MDINPKRATMKTRYPTGRIGYVCDHRDLGANSPTNPLSRDVHTGVGKPTVVRPESVEGSLSEDTPSPGIGRSLK